MESTIVGALIAAAIAVFFKTYDHYSNKVARDLKDILDIQQNTQNASSDTKLAIQEIVHTRTKEFIIEEERKSKWKSKPRRSSLKSILTVLGALTIMSFFTLLFIDLIFRYLKIIGNDWGMMPQVLLLLGLSVLIERIVEFITRSVEKEKKPNKRFSISIEINR